VRLYTRRRDDWSGRYPAVVAAPRTLKVGSCLIDGELVVCDETGVSSFERLRSRQHDHTGFLYAFDLLALAG
jgi:bifunctional non-homologous end joining protein LigD